MDHPPCSLLQHDMACVDMGCGQDLVAFFHKLITCPFKACSCLWGPREPPPRPCDVLLDASCCSLICWPVSTFLLCSLSEVGYLCGPWVGARPPKNPVVCHPVSTFLLRSLPAMWFQHRPWVEARPHKTSLLCSPFAMWYLRGSDLTWTCWLYLHLRADITRRCPPLLP